MGRCLSAAFEYINKKPNCSLNFASSYDFPDYFSSECKELFLSEDVWKHLTKQAQQDKTLEDGITVSDIASSWITKDRLPVVSVIRDYSKRTAVASQRVYLRERPHDVPEQDKMLWYIPLILVTQDKLDFKSFAPHKWIKRTRNVTLNSLPDADKFIIINPEEIGPFPVNYDEHNWNLLANYLQTENGRKAIPINTRFGTEICLHIE